MLKDDDARWKALMLIGAVLAEDVESAHIQLARINQADREELTEALDTVSNLIDPDGHACDDATDGGSPDAPDDRFYMWLMARALHNAPDIIGRLADQMRHDSCCPDFTISLRTWRNHLIRDHDLEEDHPFMQALEEAHAAWLATIPPAPALSMLRWQKEVPTVKGYYWCHDVSRNSSQHTFIVWIETRHGNLEAKVFGGAWLNVQTLASRCLFAGPVKAPALPADQEGGGQ